MVKLATLRELMNISNSLITSLKLKAKTPNEIIETVRMFILSNTNTNLHKRINEKINNLKFDVKYDNTSSEFDYGTNTVYIGINHILELDVYLHEIMHAIGTHYDGEYNLNVGLNKRYIKEIGKGKFLHVNYGYGANEGLNQHYTEKFSQNKINKSIVTNDYSFCANVMSNLARIVGDDVCLYSHLSGKGLDYLIEEVSKKCNLPNENKPLKLILQLDAYKQIARTHMIFGAEYSTDSKIMLIEAYKTLISLAINKAKFENKDILYSQIIYPDHLSGNNFSYFTQYIQSELIKYFYKEKEHIFNEQPSRYVGLQTKPFLEYSEMLFSNYVNNKLICGNYIPDKIKCGEFYNHILLNCLIHNEKTSELVYTNDFFTKLTIEIFNRSSNMTPNHDNETIQLIKHILCTRNIVRCGATISDDLIIDCTKNLDFNIYLIESMPYYFKEIFSLIDKEMLNNSILVDKIFNEVFTTKLEKYKFIKQLPLHMQQKENIQKFLIKLSQEKQNIQM